MADIDTTDWVIGCEVSVSTQTEDIRGQVFAFDKATNTVLLKQSGSTPFHSNLRLLKVNFLKGVEAIAPANGPPSPLPAVDMQRCREREAKALQAAHAEAAKTGVGVSSEAQQVFDALAKTMPCQWKQQSIVVLNELTAERQRLGLD